MSSELLGVFADEDDGVFVDEAKDFICVDAVSSARQMSRALSRVRSGFFSSVTVFGGSKHHRHSDP